MALSKTPEDETLAYYDLNADRYISRSNARRNQDPIERFCKMLKAGGSILDAGCGAGRDLEFFAKAGFHPEGFDGSSEMVARAQRALRDLSIPVRTADFRFLNLPRETYDGIWACESLVHLPPILCLRVVQTFFAALKPAGLLFASFEASSVSSHREDRMDNSSSLPNGPARHIYSYPQPEFESMLRQSGFQPLFSGYELELSTHRAVIAKRI